ncbi:MAG: integration host factor subunit beta [Chlorobium sp.]|nr:integration host factor subunit beta [Chlorobium sp.]
MNKSDMISILAEKKSVSVKVSEDIINTIFNSMTDTMIAGGKIEIRGFGSFVIKEYEGYSGRNPKSGLAVEVKPKKSPFFKVGKELKERVDGM